MTKKDSSYANEKVYRTQGADTFSIDSDGYLDFFGNAVTGEQLKKMLYKQLQVVTIGQGAGSTVLSITNLPSLYRFVILSMTSTMVQGSFWLASSPSVGDEVYLILRAGSCASGSIVFSTSGVSLVGLMGIAVSGFSLRNSTNSTAMAHLLCLSDGEWSVLETRGGYTE